MLDASIPVIWKLSVYWGNAAVLDFVFMYTSVLYDEFVGKAKVLAVKRGVGDPFKMGIEQGPQDDVLIAKDEIFGLVQCILKFKDTKEVIKRANATRYGLAARVFTKSAESANTMMRVLWPGTVWTMD